VNQGNEINDFLIIAAYDSGWPEPGAEPPSRTDRLPDTPEVVEFLKRRYASAIERGDDRTAARLRAEIDRLINGAPAAYALAGRVAEVLLRRSAGSAQLQHQRHDDDILGPHL
jgi:hypothetical protein